MFTTKTFDTPPTFESVLSSLDGVATVDRSPEGVAAAVTAAVDFLTPMIANSMPSTTTTSSSSGHYYWPKGTGYGYDGSSGEDLEVIEAQRATKEANHTKVYEALVRTLALLTPLTKEERAEFVRCVMPLVRGEMTRSLSETSLFALQASSSLFTAILELAKALSPLAHVAVGEALSPVLRKLASDVATHKAMLAKYTKDTSCSTAAAASAAAASGEPSAPAASQDDAGGAGAGIEGSGVGANNVEAASVVVDDVLNLVEEIARLYDGCGGLPGTTPSPAAPLASSLESSSMNEDGSGGSAATTSTATAAPGTAAVAEATTGEAPAASGAEDDDDDEQPLKGVRDGYVEYMRRNGLSEMSGWSARAVTSSGGSPSKGAIERIVRELSTLAAALPLSYESSALVRLDEDSISNLRFMIVGPPGTPYEHGLFFFDVSFPDSYPSEPMQCLMRTVDGYTCFNPNLYGDGTVCLSMLGTWHGDASENWHPDRSTFLQLIVSIQALIFVEEPYYNEPGYESSMGTESGRSGSAAYTRVVRQQTIRTSMLRGLANPESAFENVVAAHFYTKRAAILEQVLGWLTAGDITEADVVSLSESLSAIEPPADFLALLTEEARAGLATSFTPYTSPTGGAAPKVTHEPQVAAILTGALNTLSLNDDDDEESPDLEPEPTAVLVQVSPVPVPVSGVSVSVVSVSSSDVAVAGTTPTSSSPRVLTPGGGVLSSSNEFPPVPSWGEAPAHMYTN